MIFASAGQKKGWMIIGFDLILVLGVYFLFTQLQVAEESVERRQDGINYRLVVQPIQENRVPLEFEIESRRTSPRQIELPKGITLMISDGRESVYWRERIQQAQTIEIGAEQSRQWSQTVTLPEGTSPPYHAGFFIDSDRQGFVKIPD